jgi:hypothetical protein
VKYTAIRSEGGLLPYDLLDEILAETAPGQKAVDFGLPKDGVSLTKFSAYGLTRRNFGVASRLAGRN